VKHAPYSSFIIVKEAQEKKQIVVEMSRKTRKRIKIKGKYMQIRQRSTSKGKKGTIMGKWK